jgi:aryl-alcohol dehydrogenase-like predicted oxidoreductase
VELATKAGVDFTTGRGTVVIRNDPDYIKAAADASLLRLGTDRIDLYYLHRVSPGVPLQDSVGALAELVAEGKVLPTRPSLAATVRKIAAERGATAGQVAIAWVVAQGPRLGLPVVPIPGTKRVKWVEQNAAALDIELSPDELARLEPLAAQVVGARY